MEKIYEMNVLEYRFSGIGGSGFIMDESCGIANGRGFGKGNGRGDIVWDPNNLYGDGGEPSYYHPDGEFEDDCLND